MLFGLDRHPFLTLFRLLLKLNIIVGTARSVGKMAEKKSIWKGISDEAVRKSTCRSWNEWFKILDSWDVKEKGHAFTAKHLREHYCLSPWWAQAITIRYEYERKLRK